MLGLERGFVLSYIEKDLLLEQLVKEIIILKNKLKDAIEVIEYRTHCWQNNNANGCMCIGCEYLSKIYEKHSSEECDNPICNYF